MPLLRIRDIVPGATETWYDGPYEKDYVVQPGDLVIGMDGDFNHALWTGPPALLNQRVCRLLFGEEFVRPSFLYSVLGGYLEAVNEATPSVTVKHLSSKTVADLQLPLPAVEEQDRIVERLAHLNQRVDEGVRLLRNALDACDDLRAALLEEVLSEDAERKPIGALGEVFVGATPSRKDPSLWNGGIPWVSSGEVAFCRISRTKESITEQGLGSRERRLHPPGTLMIAMIGEGKTRGQAAILDVAAAHNQNSAAIRLDRERMVPEYLYYCLMGMYEENRRAAEGSQQPALNGSLVRAIEVPCPSLDVQRERAELLDTQLSRIEHFQKELHEQLDHAEALRRSLLRSAVDGELEPPAEASTARELLARVQQAAEARAARARRLRKTARAVLVEE